MIAKWSARAGLPYLIAASLAFSLPRESLKGEAGAPFAPIRVDRAARDTLRLLFTFDARGDLPLFGVDEADSATHLQEALRWARIAAESDRAGAAVLDCGNTFFPGVLSRFSFGSAMNEVLSLAGASAKRVSGRDFLMGPEALFALRGKSSTPFLATNARLPAGMDPFPESVILRRAGKTVILYALLDTAIVEGPNPPPPGMLITNPEAALRARVPAVPHDSSVVVCLLDESLANRYPGILEVPGVDVFAIGSSRSGPVLQSVLRNGALAVHVPPFADGFGVLEAYPDGRMSFRIDSASAGPEDSLQVARIRSVAGKWSALYRKENNGIVRTMRKPLERKQAETVAALVRERTGAEAACVEGALIQSAVLPRQIRVRDLDRLLASSPDLYMMQVKGETLKQLGRRNEFVCSGLAGTPPIDPEEIYTLALTESAARRALPEAFATEPEYHPRLWNEPLQDAVRLAILGRPKADWDFASLRGRWRLAGLLNLDVSRRQVHVWNGDSLHSVPGDLGRPVSTWELSARAPLHLYNGFQGVELASEAEYSRVDAEVGSDLLGFRLDYSLGPAPRIRPYASGTYESYLAAVGPNARPVRIRGALGAQSTLGDWTLKLGAASEKTITSRDPDPFGPFPEVFTEDSTRWDQGAEFVVEGRQDLADLLGARWPKPWNGTSLDLDLGWNNFAGASGEGARVESRLRAELSAGILGNLQVTLGLRALAAYVSRAHGAVFSAEPSTALSAEYRFKTLPGRS